MTADPSATDQRRHLLWLVVVVVAAHVFAIRTFGATFWVDSTVYAALGGCFFSPEKIASFYDATGTMMYSHICPGEPALWAFARLFPAGAQWPILAFVQHALAAGATIFAFGSLQRILPGLWNLAAAALFSLHPFHQSLHNALLTESASGSLLLIGLTLLLRLLFAAKPSRRAWAGLLAVVFLSAQFRSYLGILLAGATIFVLLWRRDVFRWPSWLALLSVSFAASVAFPVYRWALIGRYFNSSGGTNMLVCAAWTNPNPTPALLTKLTAMGWPGDPAEIFALDFGYEKAREAGVIWQQQGVSLSEIARRMTAMNRAIVLDNPSGVSIALRCALASSGMPTIAFAGSGDEPAYEHLSLPALRKHERTYHNWQSWIEKRSYQPDGYNFFVGENASGGLPSFRRELWATLEPHLSNKSVHSRDPLRLGKLPLDLWAVLGWLGTAFCLARLPILGMVFAAPLAGNFLVMGAIPLANGRYSYPVLGLWFLSCAAACGLWLGRKNSAVPLPQWLLRWRRKRAKKIVLGAGGTQFEGWYATDRETLDVLKREDFLSHWKPSSRTTFLAEHVWEHITPADAAIAARNVFEFLRPGGRFRLAVPDGLHPDPAYIEYVRPGGTGAGADDHKILYTYRTMTESLEQAGFKVVLLEYWDERGEFHFSEWSKKDGFIERSKRYDPRNQDGSLSYTSLIVDAIKPR
jgi:predicted SAM-dependent methyltransferase